MRLCCVLCLLLDEPLLDVGFVIGFFVGKKFGGVHVHLTTPALPPGYTLPPAAQLAATPTAAAPATA